MPAGPSRLRRATALLLAVVLTCRLPRATAPAAAIAGAALLAAALAIMSDGPLGWPRALALLGLAGFTLAVAAEASRRS